MPRIVGIDLSLSCPALVAHCGKSWSVKNCNFHYYTSRKKSVFSSNQFFGEHIEDFSSHEQRYTQISDFILKWVQKYKPSLVYLEGYAYASTGQVYNLGENAGIVKWRLYQLGYVVNVVPPTVIKKFATGKGNAKKIDMHEAFVVDTGMTCLYDYLQCANPDQSPSSDLVDAYFICKYGATCYAQDAIV